MSREAGSPLGVFDSGLGGLTVVRALARSLPGESVAYFGDTARVPYGNKSAATVTRLSLEAMRFLEHLGIKALVVACNSASALAMEALHGEAKVPVVGVVEAGAAAAARATQNGRVGVIGTRATIGSQCYVRELERVRPGTEVSAAACPLFVPLAEEGWLEGEVTQKIAEQYLEPLRAAEVDTLILGCTHYPLLHDVIAGVMGTGVTLIDSGDAVSATVKDLLGEEGLSAPGGAAVSRNYFVSDQAELFTTGARRFLGELAAEEASTVDQSDVPWYDRPWGGGREKGNR